VCFFVVVFFMIVDRDESTARWMNERTIKLNSILHRAEYQNNDL